MFRPSSSQYEEELGLIYYEAEENGRRKNCWKYTKYCKLNILERYSKIV